MLGYYNYTVIATYISVLSALCGMFLCGLGRPDLAVYCLLLSGVLDMIDGPIARTREREANEKRFGIQIDSFSDFMAFGVLPAAILFSMWDKAYELSTVMALCAGVASAFVALAALIRLSYFNVIEEIRQEEEGGRRKEFTGMPVTTVALILPAVCAADFVLGDLLPMVLAAVMVITGILYISKLRFRKPRGVGMIVMAVIGLFEMAMLLFGEQIIGAVFKA